MSRHDRPPQQDHSSKPAAEQLACAIAAHWHRAGFREVKAWAETTATFDDGRHRVIWGVKTNLKNGLPPSIRDTR